MQKSKVLLLGWDAADWEVIQPLIDEGKMPALQFLIENGVSGNLATLEPVFSPMLWSSIATGKRADKHGVHGFTEPDYQNGGVRPVGTYSRTTAAIWNILNQESLKSNVVGWWPSHPAEKVNGTMVSNFFQRATHPQNEEWPIPPGSVYPKSLATKMASLRVHPGDLSENHLLPFVPLAAKIDQEKDKRLGSAAKILSEAATIHNIGTWLVENTEWDFTAIYFDNIDHFCHGFMKYHPPKLKGIKEKDFETYKQVVTAAYQYHDMMLGRILNLTDGQTTIMLVSDHGFESGKNRLLSLPKENGAPAYDHRAYGIFAAMGPNIKKDELVYGANLLDITPTLLSIFNLPIGKDMDGKPLLNIFEKEIKPKYIESWDNHVKRKSEENVDSETAAEALQMMIELGYIEKPNEKSEVAFRRAKTENDFNLARVYLSSGRIELGLEILEKLYAEDKKIKFGIRIALAYNSLKKYQQCIAIIDELEGFAKNPIQQLSAIKATALFKLKRNKEAWEVLKVIVKQRPQTALAAQRIAKGLLTLRKNARANSYLDNSLNFFPDNASLIYLKGAAELRKNQFSSASNYFLKSISNQFYNPKAHLYLGDCLYKQELYEDAHRAYTISLIQKPNSKKALKGLAEIENLGFKFTIQEAEMINYQAKEKPTNALRDPQKEYLKSLKGTIYIVSGLPRSGTSMMMQMLKSAGADVLSDDKRAADENNPKGYLELDAIKSLGKNKKIIHKAVDKVIKVVSPQLKNLLPIYKYKVIFMNRNIEEVISSQHKMVGKEEKNYPAKLHQHYKSQLEDLNKHFLKQINVDCLHIDYKDAIQKPGEVAQAIVNFLPELKLEAKKLSSAVDQKLYRNKR